MCIMYTYILNNRNICNAICILHALNQPNYIIFYLNFNNRDFQLFVSFDCHHKQTQNQIFRFMRITFYNNRKKIDIHCHLFCRHTTLNRFFFIRYLIPNADNFPPFLSSLSPSHECPIMPCTYSSIKVLSVKE